jgi:broad-specificity NMP kinase
MIIHLNGWPGVGKLTIGRLLAEKLQGRLIDNHLLHDVAIRCTGLDDPQRWPLYEAVRKAAYEALANRPSSEILVMTNALCVHSPREREAWRHVVDLAVKRNVPLIPVVLEADAQENARRLQSADRTGRKLTDPEALKAFMLTDQIQRPDVPELLEIDTTRLAPDETCAAIENHLASLMKHGALRAASLEHVKMKTAGTG